MSYLWTWYHEVMGPEPLTYTELHAWSILTKRDLLAWEAEVLKSLDRIFRSVMNE